MFSRNFSTFFLSDGISNVNDLRNRTGDDRGNGKVHTLKQDTAFLSVNL